MAFSTGPTHTSHPVTKGPLSSADRSGDFNIWADCHLLDSTLGQAAFSMSPSFCFLTCKNRNTKTHPLGLLWGRCAGHPADPSSSGQMCADLPLPLTLAPLITTKRIGEQEPTHSWVPGPPASNQTLNQRHTFCEDQPGGPPPWLPESGLSRNFCPCHSSLPE